MNGAFVHRCHKFESFHLPHALLSYICYVELLMDAVLHRIPAIEKAEVRQIINGPESITPDGRALLGEVPEVSCFMPSVSELR